MIAIFIVLRKWTTEGGINGETCADSETRDGGVLWCDNVIIPDCEDRTINCTAPPIPKKCADVRRFVLLF